MFLKEESVEQFALRGQSQREEETITSNLLGWEGGSGGTGDGESFNAPF